MQVDKMRFMDRWVGVPISLVLTGARRLGDLFRRGPAPPPQRIVIIKLVEQGATVIAAPALHRAVELVGRENVFFAVFDENRFILDVLDIVPPENVIELRSGSLFATGLDTLRALWRLRRENVDTAIDFEFFSRFSGAFTYLSGARRRIGFHSFAGEAGYRGDLMTHRIGYNFGLHASETYQVLVEAAALPAETLPTLDFKPLPPADEPPIAPGETELEEVRSILRRVLGRDEIPPIILFNANSGDLLPLRRWPTERYVELARRLLDTYPEATIAFTGSPAEREAAEAVVSEVGSDRCVSVAGETTLAQLLVLYHLAEVLLTNDSGPAHFASLTTVDVVTLFGPETPEVFGARTPRSHIVWAGLACSPCVNAFNQRVTTCQNNLCMQRIEIDDVYEVVCDAYANRDRAVAPNATAAQANPSVLPSAASLGKSSAS